MGATWQRFCHRARHPKSLLLAGGMGIVPFVGYVSEHPKPWNVSMLFGHREHTAAIQDSINEHAAGQPA